MFFFFFTFSIPFLSGVELGLGIVWIGLEGRVKMHKIRPARGPKKLRKKGPVLSDEEDEDQPKAPTSSASIAPIAPSAAPAPAPAALPAQAAQPKPAAATRRPAAKLSFAEEVTLHC